MTSIKVNGITLAYNNCGQGEPILFLHGIYCSRRQWQMQSEAFSEKYRVITVDLRGHGQSSSAAAPYSINQFAADLVGLLDHLELPQAVVCGHSFGGLVAQELALSYPERVKGLVLAETMYGLSSTPWEAAWAAAMNMWLPQVWGTRQHTQVLANFFGMYTPGSAAYILDEAQRHLADEPNQQNIMRASLKFDSRWRLHRLNCPTLLLVGSYPHLPLIHWQNWEMYWRIRGAKLKFVPKAGHLLFWDNPNAFNHAIEEFVAGLS